MIIQGRFIGDAPYFGAHLSSAYFQGQVWFLADTGASHTILLDRDAKLLNIPVAALKQAALPMTGIGGSVRSFQVQDVELTMLSSDGNIILREGLWVVKHNLEQLPPEEAARILRLPSVMGRDLINQFCFVCNYKDGIVQLKHKVAKVRGRSKSV